MTIRSRLFLAAGVCGVAAILMWTYSSSTPQPRPVTLDEAARMALARYTTFQTSPARVRVQAPIGGATVVVNAIVDYRVHHAVGSYELPEGPTGMLAWDMEVLRIATVQTGDPLVAAASIQPSEWSPRAFTTDPLDVALRLVMSLGQSRPDNAQVLAQQVPQWLRQEHLDGKDVDVFSGPRPRSAEGSSPLNYWIGSAGELRRVTLRIAGIESLVTIEFLGGAGAEVPARPWGSV